MAPRRNNTNPLYPQHQTQQQQQQTYQQQQLERHQQQLTAATNGSGIINIIGGGTGLTSDHDLLFTGGGVVGSGVNLDLGFGIAAEQYLRDLQLENSNNTTSSIIFSTSSSSACSTPTAIMSPMQPTNSTNSRGGGGGGNAAVSCGGVGGGVVESNATFTRCCLPNVGDCFFKTSPPAGINATGGDFSATAAGLIRLDNLGDCVRVICNNENCSVGQYMHRECFESWEQTILVALKANGRARSWSDRQRLQNLWTKKGYDLVYKACSCKCGSGHIRKDLEWSPGGGQQSKSANFVGNGTAVAAVNGGGSGSSAVLNGSVGSSNVRSNSGCGGGGGSSNDNDSDATKKKKKRNRNNQKPTLALAAINPGVYHPNSQQHQQQQQQQQHHHQQHQQQQQQQQSPSVSNGVVHNSSNSSSILSNGNGPPPNVGVIGSGLHGHNNSNNHNHHNDSNNHNHHNDSNSALVAGNGGGSNNSFGGILGIDLRARAGSLSSSNDGSTSPQTSNDLNCSTPIHRNSHRQHQQSQQLSQQQMLQNGGFAKNNCVALFNNNYLGSPLTNCNGNGNFAAIKQQQQQSLTSSSSSTSSASKLQQQQQQQQQYSPIEQQLIVQQQKNKEVEIYSERVRSTSGCNGIFSRRLDFSSFNLLPKTRLNSYQVKIEDEGTHGNDETRLFILSSLAQSQMSRVACILCEEPMLVFDRYPLVDGSFFLSPKQHSPQCIEVKYEGRTLYLTCVCMSCLDDSSSSCVIRCRFCGVAWRGSQLVLGTMYAYDIFAAMPCCVERLKCNACFKLLLHPQQKLNFYSDYSHPLPCSFCATHDTHFVKPLSFCYTKSVKKMHPQLA